MSDLDESSFDWSDLRAHWEKSYAEEQANPPSDKPTYGQIAHDGRFAETAPINEWVWIIEPPSVGVHLGRQDAKGRWWIAEAGDLWPSKPTLWFPRSITKDGK